MEIALRNVHAGRGSEACGLKTKCERLLQHPQVQRLTSVDIFEPSEPEFCA